ncbi:MAG TPA: flagellar hook-length control protein FliK, partial [Candidatus Cloacimonadota bacterium]|nr:flagellar hook-length control protein FliK [Candidatus Cloacimonadota bacterium]
TDTQSFVEKHPSYKKSNYEKDDIVEKVRIEHVESTSENQLLNRNVIKNAKVNLVKDDKSNFNTKTYSSHDNNFKIYPSDTLEQNSNKHIKEFTQNDKSSKLENKIDFQNKILQTPEKNHTKLFNDNSTEYIINHKSDPKNSKISSNHNNTAIVHNSFNDSDQTPLFSTSELNTKPNSLEKTSNTLNYKEPTVSSDNSSVYQEKDLNTEASVVTKDQQNRFKQPNVSERIVQHSLNHNSKTIDHATKTNMDILKPIKANQENFSNRVNEKDTVEFSDHNYKYQSMSKPDFQNNFSFNQHELSFGFQNKESKPLKFSNKQEKETNEKTSHFEAVSPQKRSNISGNLSDNVSEKIHNMNSKITSTSQILNYKQDLNVLPDYKKKTINIEEKNTSNIVSENSQIIENKRNKIVEKDMAQQMQKNNISSDKISSTERMKGRDEMFYVFENSNQSAKESGIDMIQDHIDNREPFIVQYLDNNGQEKIQTIVINNKTEKNSEKTELSQNENKLFTEKTNASNTKSKQQNQSELNQESKSQNYESYNQNYQTSDSHTSQEFSKFVNRMSFTDFLPKLQETVHQLRQNKKNQKAVFEIETEELGLVKANIEKHGEKIYVRFEVEDIQRLESLKENMNQLEQQLKSQGFNDVFVEYDFNKESSQHQPQHASKKSSNHHFGQEEQIISSQNDDILIKKDYGYNSIEYTI